MSTLTAVTGIIAFVLASTGAIAAASVLFALAMLLVLATPYTQKV